MPYHAQDDDDCLPFSHSDFSSKTVFSKCFCVIRAILGRLASMEEICNIKEFVLLEDIERCIINIETVLKKLQKRDIVFLGNTGVGKSFLLNHLFVMTSVDPRQYTSSDFRNARKRLKGKSDVTFNFSDDGRLPVLRILNYPNSSEGRDIPGLEALRSLNESLAVLFVDPVPRWKGVDPQTARKFESNPAEDHQYRLQRYEGKVCQIELSDILSIINFCGAVLQNTAKHGN